MLNLHNTQRGYTPAVAKRRVSKEAYEPMWRRRIASAVEPHGRLTAIADAADMKAPQLQKIANGTTKNPGVVVLERIAHAMGVLLEDLVAEPRPEGTAGHEHGVGGGAGLADSLRRALADYEKTGQFPNDWRGDIMLAIFTLTRALQRPTAAGGVEGQAKQA